MVYKSDKNLVRGKVTKTEADFMVRLRIEMALGRENQAKEDHC